jgi:uncharacterized protein (DUF1684 family)
MTVQEIEQTAYDQQWSAWRRQHEKRLADPHGFLAITGLHWLDAEARRFDDAPGAWSTGVEGVTVVLADDEELVVDGVTVRGTHHFGVLPERGGVNAAFGDAVVEVAKRGGFHIVRPRHPEHPLRAGFAGVPTYPPSPAWVLGGRYVPFEEPRDVTVGAAVEGLQHVYESPGRVEFEHAGEQLSLTTFNGREPGRAVHPFHRRHLRRHHLCRQPDVVGRRPGGGRHRGAGLQPRGEPGLRVHGLRHLPAATCREPPADRGRGRREDPLRAAGRKGPSRTRALSRRVPSR